MKSRLERLTTDELKEMAEQAGIDIPAGLDRAFILAELLDAASDSDSDSDAEPSLGESAAPESVQLPKQYNITFIEVLIRDPLWVFAFWEMKGADREFYEKAPNFGGYRLRVSNRDGAAGSRGPLSPPAPRKHREDSFTVSVGPADTAWYLGFSPEGGRFAVELCAVLGGKDAVLAASRPFTLPKLVRPPYIKDVQDAHRKKDALYDNPLALLSGAEDFRVIRSGDRRSRLGIEYE